MPGSWSAAGLSSVAFKFGPHRPDSIVNHILSLKSTTMKIPFEPEEGQGQGQGQMTPRQALLQGPIFHGLRVPFPP